ncbi:protein kintoun isoform X1 [Hylaeus anthracinus]|uniref:protein kintoun isoform X1 n=1 Tax=Hylaeus anthracinus TaxID=313031 RepID=UPI0023B8D60C|nr:protein kintoun isoform X1 [Hylaeus anthracinus]
MDAHETYRKDWEDLDVTKQELKTLTECLKKEEFRKLLVEYAEEVTDPENRKIYEKEITQLEKERNVDITFVRLDPGYVIKTSVNGDTKCFVNICKSDVVEKLSSQPVFEQGHRNLQWSIPHILIPPRDELDKKNVRCLVFDVMFHPDAIYLASRNAGFRDTINVTAIDSIESKFKMKLDRKNLRFPNIKYKGVPLSAVIRKPSKEPPKEKLDMEPEIYQKLMADYDRKREQQYNRVQKKPTRASPPVKYYQDKVNANEDTNSKYVTPKFSIKHQSDIELEDFSTSKTAKMNATVPKRLIIGIDLPLLKTTDDAVLDVQERYLTLKSEKPAKYLLELPLPYHVDADRGNAKFDPKYKKLVVTLPVIPPTVLVSDTREDSGVDSDSGSPVPLLHEDSLSSGCSNDCMPKLIEECETALTVATTEHENENFKECSDTALWTNSIENTNAFMDSSIIYSLPPFTCNIYDNQLAITVNVKNVNPDSISHRILQNNSGLHILLASIGAGFFPQHFSLCLEINEDSINPDSFTSEPWDNNVVFTVVLKNPDNLARYYVGVNEEFMEEKNFPTAVSFKNQLKELTAMEDAESEKDRTINVLTEDDGVVINITPNQLDSDNEVKHEFERSTQQQESQQQYGGTENRSVSECITDKTTDRTSGTFLKGILKSRRTHDFSRSVSGSSTDEYEIPSSIDCQYDSALDLNSESDWRSLKKKVRFNALVSRQIFRPEISILGHSKKHQRKLTTRLVDK